VSDLYYFAADGNYGDAEGLVVVDVSAWSKENWVEVSDEYDRYRAETALVLATQHSDSDVPALSVVDGSFDVMNETQATLYLATMETSSFTWRGVGSSPEKALAAIEIRWVAEMRRHPEMYTWQEAQEMYGVDLSVIHDGYSDRR